MAINQPPITGDPTLDAWMLEVARELNSGTGISSGTSSTTTTTSTSPVRSVDTTGILNLSGTGRLSSDDVVTSIQVGTGPVQTGPVQIAASGGGFNNVNLVQTDYLLRLVNPIQSSYQFTMAPDICRAPAPDPIPETHMLFLGGLRLCESTSTTTRDYNISGNTINLERTSTDFAGLDLVLTVFTASLS